MKVILKAEVDNLGLAGDVVDVADGYGRNYLIPRGLAIRATAGAMREAEALTRSRKAHEAKTIDSARQAAGNIEGRVLRIPVRVDDAGHLYGSVSVGDVQRVLKERGHQVDKRRIELKGTIKTIGTYEIPIHVHPQVSATVTVEVVDIEGKVGVQPSASDEAVSIEEAALEAAAELEGTLDEETAADRTAGDDVADAPAADDEPASSQDEVVAQEEPADA